MSAARPKIADYPFTTLHPNLGVVQAGDHRFTVADVPGLIEGASEGKGLGLEFLRHVERCSALLHVLDCATLEPGRDPLTDLDVILAELAAYPVPEGQVPLLERPQLIALNKIDVPEARELAELVRPELEARGYRVFEISTVSHEGLRQLGVRAGRARRRRAPESRAARPHPRIVLRPKAVDEAEFTVRVEGGSYGTIYRVLGAKPERWVRRPTSRTTRPSATSPTGSRGSASRTSSCARARSPARPSSSAPGGRRLRLGAHAHLDGGAHHRARAVPTSASTTTAAPRAPSAAATTTSAWMPRPRPAPSSSASARPACGPTAPTTERQGRTRASGDARRTRDAMATAKRIVVKVGSSSISGENAGRSNRSSTPSRGARARRRGGARLLRRDRDGHAVPEARRAPDRPRDPAGRGIRRPERAHLPLPGLARPLRHRRGPGAPHRGRPRERDAPRRTPSARWSGCSACGSFRS